MKIPGSSGVPEALSSDGAFQGFRFLDGNNNNQNYNQNNAQDNNNKNNNQQQQQGDNQNYNNYVNVNALNVNFNVSMFTSTIAFCALVTLLVIFRIKCHRRSERKRKRLGISRSSVRRNQKNSITNSFDEDDDNIVTDEEIRRFILPSKKEKSIQEAAKVVRCDRETERIMDLCKPFWLQAFVSGICDVLNTALVGKTLGVDALAIYYIVTVPTSFTDTIVSAVLGTVSSLGGQSIGVGSYKLTGQYCQISIILYTLLFIPHAIIWMIYLKPTLRWFAPDLDEDVIQEGYDYFLVGLIGTYIGSFSTVLHSLLEVTDHAGYGMYSGVISDIVGVLGFFIYIKINPASPKSIVWVEIIWTIMELVFLVIDLLVTKRMRWFDDFWKGILRSVAMKNWEAVWLVLRTAAPMSIGNIILTVEWELLAIFAAHMGGSHVAAWGIVGTIWGILEYATDCVAEAGEIRVAKLLGKGNPRGAKLSAYKCLFLGNLFALLMSIVFLIGMPIIPGWFTDDEYLQSLVAGVLPYCAIGNLTLTLGSLAWTLVGAQGRYSVATFHGCIGSLGVTIPLASVGSFYLNWGLPSLAAAVVVGYMVSGAFNVITLFLSDWDYIAYRVMIRNGAIEAIEEDEGSISRWNVFNFMSKKIDENFIDDHSGHRSKNKGTVLVDTLNENSSSMSVNTDDSKTLSSKPSVVSNVENTPVTSTSSWWSAFGFDYKEGEVRSVVIGPGKLGYTIQSTERGPMIVGCPQDSIVGETFLDAISNHLGSSDDNPSRAKIIEGELFLGDIIVEVDKTSTEKMSGKDLAKLLHRKQKRRLRTLTVSHREGTGLATVYQPGPYGSAAIAGVLKNAKDIEEEEFEDEGVVGAGYLNMGWFS